MVEASFHLGDRLLYHRHRPLRGDDVSTLQRLLGAMGFDAGRVDGIFGPQTALALADFQRNAGLVVDAICGPSTLQILGQLAKRSGKGDPVVSIRELERIRGASLLGRRIVVGHQGGAEALADAVVRSLTGAGATATVAHHPEGAELARAANEVDADVFVGLSLDPEGTGCWTAFYSHPRGWQSPGGRRLAEMLQPGLSQALGVEDLGVRGMTIPVLLETTMPAIVCDLAPPSVAVERSAQAALELTRCLTEWVCEA